MEPMDLIHTVQVLRESRAIVDSETVFGDYAEQFAGLKCLVEPMGAWHQSTILGELSGFTWVITWGTEVLKSGDRVIWDGKPHEIKMNARDVFRGENTTLPPYQTGFLSEEIRPRD